MEAAIETLPVIVPIAIKIKANAVPPLNEVKNVPSNVETPREKAIDAKDTGNPFVIVTTSGSIKITTVER
ncbi:MAG: hypothetical protein AAFX80_22425 [Cyanobacteria bacterium J06639_18]